MQSTQGSRFLNDNGGLLGINTFDLLAAIAVLMVFSEVLKPFELEFVSVPIAIGSLIALIPIRLRYRRKIIRDTLHYLLTSKVIYDPKKRNSRIISR